MLKSIRILLSISTFYDYEIWHMDVKTALLNGNLEESIYMSQPEGFIEQDQEQMASYAISNERSGRCTIRSRNPNCSKP